MKVHIFENKETLFERLSDFYINEIKKNPEIVLGLATGGTPVPLYEALAKDHKENKTSYQKVRTYNLDEYIGIDEFHEQSYRTFMNKQLFDHIDINKENTFVPKGNTSDVELECKIYDEYLDKTQIDIQLLGIGTNAHIGFNEPGSDLNGKTMVVDLTEETKDANVRFFNDISEVPTKSITMGIGSILKAKKIILVATGKNKAEAIKNTIEGIVTKDVPASALQTHLDVEIYLDKEAASLLK